MLSLEKDKLSFLSSLDRKEEILQTMKDIEKTLTQDPNRYLYNKIPKKERKEVSEKFNEILMRFLEENQEVFKKIKEETKKDLDEEIEEQDRQLSSSFFLSPANLFLLRTNIDLDSILETDPGSVIEKKMEKLRELNPRNCNFYIKMLSKNFKNVSFELGDITDTNLFEWFSLSEKERKENLKNVETNMSELNRHIHDTPTFSAFWIKEFLYLSDKEVWSYVRSYLEKMEDLIKEKWLPWSSTIKEARIIATNKFRIYFFMEYVGKMKKYEKWIPLDILNSLVELESIVLKEVRKRCSDFKFL